MTAHLTAQCDDGFDKLISRRGEETAKLWYESQAACLDRIETLQKELAIQCDFRRLDGHLFHADGTDESILDKEYEATRKVGMPIRRERGVPFRGKENTRSLLYPNQATFHPLEYLAGLASVIQAAGGRFYADSMVESVEEDTKRWLHARRMLCSVEGGTFSHRGSLSPSRLQTGLPWSPLCAPSTSCSKKPSKTSISRKTPF